MAKPKYAVELKSGSSPASFMANGKAIELTDENPRFETSDQMVYAGIRDLPFLKDLGQTKVAKPAKVAKADEPDEAAEPEKAAEQPGEDGA